MTSMPYHALRRTPHTPHYVNMSAVTSASAQVVKGSSPLWIRFLIGILRLWFFVYDCLNYIPYQLFNSPTEKLRKAV
ncbi:unnamed protein product [Cylicostephanus goldi]|uniref:Uncharacterized protein n=1 Tax=Cylicostephanus goldi TaxID=71465 RepID=A0A3P6RWS4_CYLGO|nr:unnamed protein product [Cylicostephanus goldi]